MDYNKPEITSLASASCVIQGSKTYDPMRSDSQDIPNFATVSAYESDE